MSKISRGLNGREYPVELQPGFLRDGTRTDTPVRREAVAVLARRSRGHALVPARLVPKDPAKPVATSGSRCTGPRAGRHRHHRCPLPHYRVSGCRVSRPGATRAGTDE